MEGDSRGHIEKLKKQTSNMDNDASTIFQSSWVRHNTVLDNPSDWKSLVRQFRYVLYCGIILWTIHFISLAIS